MSGDVLNSLDSATAERLFDRVSQPVYVVEREGQTVEDCNSTFTEAFGYAEREVVDSRESELYPSGSLERLNREVRELDDGESVEGVELQVRTSDGSERHVLLHATVVEVDGEPLRFCFLHDVTSYRETERQLREHAERLEQSNRDLEQFAYLASHDLQEPLRMVASYTQLLERKYRDQLDATAQKYIDYAVDGAERMKALINDLLDYSRAAGTDAEFEVVDLDEVVQRVKDNLRIRIQETDAEVAHQDLPTVRGVPTQLEQVVQNLVENAIKFAGEGPPRVEIAAERCDEGRWRVSVTDNGIGFDPENADSIFQIFQRLHERDAYEGTGTGLAIVKKVVDLHGGDVGVDSEPGVGSEIWFTLPAVDQSDTA